MCQIAYLILRDSCLHRCIYSLTIQPVDLGIDTNNQQWEAKRVGGVEDRYYGSWLVQRGF